LPFWSRRSPDAPQVDIPWEERWPLEALVRGQLDGILSVEQRHISGRALAFGGRLLVPATQALEHLRGRLSPHGYTPFLREEAGAAWVHALPLGEVTGRPNPAINVALFLATVVTTLMVGARASLSELVSDPARLLAGVPFSASLLSILLFHEFGHYIFGRRHGMPVSLPYFIPAPPQIFIVGTLGAVIRLRGPVRDRRALFDMAVAGPLAGLVLAIPVCALGLKLSTVVPLSRLGSGGGLELGESLLLKLLVWLVFGPLPADHTVLLHDVGLAAWFGFYVTVLNLIPAGQLDGGHLVYALFGSRHATISRLAAAGLVLLGLWFSFVWVVWALLIVLLMGFRHSPPMDDITPLDGQRRALGAFSLLLLFVLLPPVPISIR
jgi:membrane-associated protease RseP (regulator of RpoE activity)